MDTASKPKSKKAPDILVLHCLNPDCRGLLAYEVDSDNVLYVNLAWTARADTGYQYFPCPSCGGKNVVEGFKTVDGAEKHRVTRWEV